VQEKAVIKISLDFRSAKEEFCLLHLVLELLCSAADNCYGAKVQRLSQLSATSQNFYFSPLVSKFLAMKTLM